MELKKDKWMEIDIVEFQNYLRSFENKQKLEWCANLLKTKLPVLVIKTKDLRNIAGEIYKGNYRSFLDFMVWEYYENTAINGFLISKIKDFDEMEKYLKIYSLRADNWATCDLLTFNTKGKEEQYYQLSKLYAKSSKPFARRIGMNMLFNLVENDKYIDKILDLLSTFIQEEHYYVNMVNAWLLCDCFIKQRKKTLAFFEQYKLNKFTQNKAIQKCRESFRVCAEDKQMLLKFKLK